MASIKIEFYQYPQDTALSIFLPILKNHLPLSNPVYNRLRAPHNVPSRHCVFAASFDEASAPNKEDIYTILFADRSRHLEMQIWIVNSLMMKPSLAPADRAHLTEHVKSSLLFLKTIRIPEAPGWPFQPILKIACLHEHIFIALAEICKRDHALVYSSFWNVWALSLSEVNSMAKARKSLPEGLSVSRVPADQVELVVKTSSVPRQVSTLLLQPSVGILNEDGKLVAWGYIGTDGSFSTLHVLPEYRGKGLASHVAVELLGRLGNGEFDDLGFDGKSGWAHSDVEEGNKASEAVMRFLGGVIKWKSYYVWVDSSKFTEK